MPGRKKSKKRTGQVTAASVSSKVALVKEKKTKTVEKPKPTVTELIAQIRDAVNTYDYTKSEQLCKTGLESYPDNIELLELVGEVMLETGTIEAAQQCYGRSIELSPNEGFMKYLSMGQILAGTESLQCYTKGIEIMLQQIDDKENQDFECGAMNTENTASKRDVSGAYLSIAELYMTDLCDEENAETECVSAIKQSITQDETNPESYQVMADYYLVKGGIQSALEYIKKSTSLWLPSARQAAAVEEDEEIETSCDPVEPISLSLDYQLKTAKTLIEVELHQEACEVLELLLDQDDEMIDVWYLLGWSNYLQGEEYKSTAKFYLLECQKRAVKLKYEDEDVLQHVKELLQELESVQDDNDDEGMGEEAEDLEMFLLKQENQTENLQTKQTDEPMEDS